MSLHDGHRERIRERFLESGLDGFNECQVLEMLLFYSCPRKDTNELAHRLLDEFGSLVQVLEAPVKELQKVPGIGDAAATLISFAASLSRYYLVCRAKDRGTALNTISECGNYLLPYFLGRANETVYMLCQDAKRKVLCCKLIGEGSINSAGVPIRRVVEMAIASNATTVVLAHNHPGGVAIPSEEDVATTKFVAAALHNVDVILSDHMIFANSDYVSVVESGRYNPGSVYMTIR